MTVSFNGLISEISLSNFEERSAILPSIDFVPLHRRGRDAIATTFNNVTFGLDRHGNKPSLKLRWSHTLPGKIILLPFSN